MRFILFFLLRRFFVRAEYNSSEIVVTKGIFFIRTAVVPLASIVRITVRRSLFLRLFRAKEVKVYCNLGGVSFFLSRDEEFAPFGAFPDSAAWKSASFAEEALGAFCDTHALGGVFLFAAALIRSGKLLGNEYSERAVSLLEKMLSDTIENVSGILQSVQIFIPRAAVVIAVLVLAGWAFAFFKKLLGLMRFRVAFDGERVFVKSGVFTLYEHTLFPNSSEAVYEQSVIFLLLNRALVRVRGVIVFPSVKRGRVKHDCRPTGLPALWGYCGVPVTFALLSGAALIAARSAELVGTVLYCVLFASLYAAFVRACYMRFSGLSEGESSAALTARRGLRLYSGVIPKERIVCTAFRSNLFRKERGNLVLYTRGRLKFRIQHIIPIWKGRVRATTVTS